MRKTSPKTCTVCGNIFLPRYAERKTCSRACYLRLIAQMKINGNWVTCPVCSREFWVEPNQILRGEGKCCSQSCAGIQRSKVIRGASNPRYNPKNHIRTTCEICEHEFITRQMGQRACSAVCGRKLAGLARLGSKNHNYVGPQERQCPACKSMFLVPNPARKQIYCSKHCSRIGSRNSQYQKITWSWWVLE